jgi:hypothetical protein
MSFIKIQEGHVVDKSQFLMGYEASAMSRMAYNKNGELMCSHVESKNINSNSFVVIISRSKDNGKNFERIGPAFPELIDKKSIGGSISSGNDGKMYMYGSIYNIDEVNEIIWDPKTRALKQNNIFYAVSEDGGYSWSEPIIIPFEFPCAAETACTLQVTADGSFISCYAPHNSMDGYYVDKEQIIFIKSSDKGKTWRYNKMLRFEKGDLGAEAWVVEMREGLYCGASWRQRFDRGFDYENAIAFSRDKGKTWTKLQGLGFKGQALALTPIPNGNVLMVYNQRFHDKPGVWVAEIGFDGEKAVLISNQIVWSSQKPTVDVEKESEKVVWTNFSFGEPYIMPLNDGDHLVSFWCTIPEFCGIKTVRIRKN